MYEIKLQNQAHGPLTCDFYIINCHPFGVTCDGGVWADRRGEEKKKRRREGCYCWHAPAVVERRIKQNKYYSSTELC